MKSSFLKLDLADVCRVLYIMAAAIFVLALEPVIQPMAQSGTLPSLVVVKGILIKGIGIGLLDIGRRLLTNSNDKFGKAEPLPTILPKD